MDQCFIHIQEDSLEVGVLLAEFDLFARGGYFECFSEPKDLDTLVEMLPVQIHEVGRLVFFEAAIQVALVVHSMLVCLLIFVLGRRGIVF